VRMNEVTHQPNAALLLLEPSGGRCRIRV